MSQRHFAGEASEAGALVGTGAGQSKIFIDDDYLLLGPAQLTSSISQGVLAGGGFAVMLDLARRGLANVHEGGALSVSQLDLGGISHWSAPDFCLGCLGSLE
jgi:hypothetical protein